jgi:hypothetical protein
MWCQIALPHSNILRPARRGRRQVEHKIQSKGGGTGLSLHLAPVPKTLGLVRSVWCPRALVVSFKVGGSMHARVCDRPVVMVVVGSGGGGGGGHGGVLRCVWWEGAGLGIPMLTRIAQLETDEALLQPKALEALSKYGMHMVVANLLPRRYDEVVLYTSDTVRAAAAARRQYTHTHSRTRALEVGGHRHSARSHGRGH